MINILLILTAAILFPGLITWFRSRLSGRKGPGILQPLKDIIVLLRKGTVYSHVTSPVFRIAPLVMLASVIAVTTLVPVGSFKPLLSFNYDFVLFSYLLALGKFFSIIGALDTGSSFEGMGANREALYSMLVEPAFFILMGSLAMLTGHTSFHSIFTNFFLEGNHLIVIFGIICLYILLQVMMIEACRVPADDPKTHLELTMIHEVMILDNAGPDKAFIHLAVYIKMVLYGSLIFSGLIPSEITPPLQAALYLATIVILALVVAFIESFRARNKLKNNPKYILTLTAVSFIAFVVILLITHKIGA